MTNFVKATVVSHTDSYEPMTVEFILASSAIMGLKTINEHNDYVVFVKPEFILQILSSKFLAPRAMSIDRIWIDSQEAKKLLS